MQWLQQQPPAATCVLVGGGPPVDALRTLAQLSDYSLEFLHWLCIDAMDLSFRLVQQQWSHWDFDALRTPEQLQAWQNTLAPELALVHIKSFYSRDNYQQQPIALPLDWSTTSDSLAALLALRLDADELVLIKSCRVANPSDLKELSSAGIVDAHSLPPHVSSSK